MPAPRYREAGAVFSAEMTTRRCSVDAGCVGRGAARARQYHDLGADMHAVIEIDHVLVDQADAARGHVLADRLRRVGAVDAVHRAAEIHGTGAEGIAGAAGHETRQVGLAVDHFRRRRPVRPLGLALDQLDAGPGEAFTADADAVAHRLAAGHHEIEERVPGIDDDGAGRLIGAVVDDLAAQFTAQLARVFL